MLVLALLFSEGLASEEEYSRGLDKAFLNDPENRKLLELECETDRKKQICSLRTWFDYHRLEANPAGFGRILMGRLKKIYQNCSDIRTFGDQMYGLWESLPGNIQEIAPFSVLCYADDPLSYGDEAQARGFYEAALNYYDPKESG